MIFKHFDMFFIFITDEDSDEDHIEMLKKEGLFLDYYTLRK